MKTRLQFSAIKDPTLSRIVLDLRLVTTIRRFRRCEEEAMSLWGNVTWFPPVKVLPYRMRRYRFSSKFVMIEMWSLDYLTISTRWKVEWPEEPNHVPCVTFLTQPLRPLLLHTLKNIKTSEIIKFKSRLGCRTLITSLQYPLASCIAFARPSQGAQEYHLTESPRRVSHS